MSIRSEELQPPGFLSTELANSITHGVGCALSIAALAVLVALAAVHGTARHVVACSIYGSTLILLYLSSTLYHSIWHQKTKQIFEIIDHSAIYLLIAGTYTPFTLIALDGGWRWSLFGIVWGLAVLGVVFKAFYINRFPAISMGVYLGMGWLCVVAVKPLLENLTTSGFLCLLAGGISYTVGTIFYGWAALPFHHAIWHLFVMGGSVCHFFSVMFLILPTAA